MLIPLLILAIASGRPTRAVAPPTDSASSVDWSRTAPDSKWTYVFPQFLAGVGGAALGGLGGAVAGGMVGVFVWAGSGGEYESECNTVCAPDAGSQVETGARIGALVGGAVGVVRVVVGAAPKAFPSRNPLATFAGAFAGGGAGWIATRSMVESDGGYTWPRWGVLALSSSLGAVLADRLTAAPLPVTITPWAPTPGADGLMISWGF